MVLAVEGVPASLGRPLKCSSCYAPLRSSQEASLGGLGGPDGVLRCEYCGTQTRLEDAHVWASEVDRWLERRFGGAASNGPRAVVDTPLRSYIFQRDVVDHLASRFLSTARFLSPTIATFDAPGVPTLRDEMEYGLEIEDYLRSLSMDANLPDNAEISSLAGTPLDADEAHSQGRKVRSLSYFAHGLIELHRAADMIAKGELAPPTSAQLDIAETYFEGASKSSAEAAKLYPSDTFYASFQKFSAGASLYAKALRLHSCGYVLDAALDRAVAAFESVATTQPILLDRSRRATVFIDPSKARLREKVETKFAQAAADNAARIRAYRAEVAQIPEQVGRISALFRETGLQYLKAKGRIFFYSLALLGTLAAILFGGYVISLGGIRALYTATTASFFGVGSVMLCIFVILIHMQMTRRASLARQYQGIVYEMAYPLARRVELCTANSPQTSYHYQRPWDQLSLLFYGQIVRLGWMAYPERIRGLASALESIPGTPSPLNLPPPRTLLVPRKDRPSEEFRQHPAIDFAPRQLRLPLFTFSLPIQSNR